MKKIAIFLLFILSINAQTYQIKYKSKVELEASYIWDNEFSISSDGKRIATAKGNKDSVYTGSDDEYSVIVLENNDGTWAQIGQSIAVRTTYWGTNSLHYITLSADGKRLAIGEFDMPDAPFGYGQVRIFEFSNNKWNQIGSTINEKLLGANFQYAGEFGSVVALSNDGSRVAITEKEHGGPRDDIGVPKYPNIGAVYILEYSNEEWTQIGKTIIGKEAYSGFGRSISWNLNMDRIAIGARPDASDCDDVNGKDLCPDFGYVQIYELSNSEWVQLGGTISGDSLGGAYGVSQSISLNSKGTRIAMSSSEDKTGVRIFDYSEDSDSTWTQIGQTIKVSSVNETYRTGTGLSMSSEGNRVIFNIYDSKSVPSGDPNFVQVYEYNDSKWVQVDKNLYTLHTDFDTNWDKFTGFGDNVAFFTDDKSFVITDGSFFRNKPLVYFYEIPDEIPYSSLTDITIKEDQTYSVVFISKDANGNNITFSAESDNDSVSVSLSSSSLTLTPKANWSGVANIKVSATVGGTTLSVSFKLTVTPVSDIANILDVTINEDEKFEQSLNSTFAGTTTFTATSDTNAVTTSISSSKLTLTPNANWHGVANIKVYASDGSVKDSTSFKFIVKSVNDLPTAFEWVSSALDTINITKTNLATNYKLEWTTSKDEADGDTIDYLLYAGTGTYPKVDVYDTTSTTVLIPYQAFLENTFEQIPMVSGATVRFSVYAHDDTDSVKVTGDDRVVYVNRYEYLSTADDQIPTDFALHENYPNPFNPTTTLRFDLPEVSDVNVVIYNMLGQKVRTFNMNRISAGSHSIKWNATNDLGDPVGAGVYLYQFQAKDFINTKKMVLLK